MITIYYGPKDKIAWHRVDVYDAVFVFGVCHDIDRMHRRDNLCKVFDTPDKEHNDAIGLCMYRRRNIGILIERDYLTHDTIAHEVSHATHRLLDYCGLQLTEGTQEAFACLTGYFTKLVYADLKKWGIKVK